MPGPKERIQRIMPGESRNAKYSCKERSSYDAILDPKKEKIYVLVIFSRFNCYCHFIFIFPTYLKLSVTNAHLHEKCIMAKSRESHDFNKSLSEF